ncbi:hypothetical protein MCOR09_007731 [Pyricularia oryzae]|nr:hypothetical protein MCOR09_007731 [Pyricularia oryzae]
MDIHQGGRPALSQRTHGQLVFFLAIFGILYCLRENKLRAAGKRDHRLEGLTEDETLHLGYRHPSFRYIT